MCALDRRPLRTPAPAWVAALDMPVWVTTSTGEMRYINPRMEELIGFANASCAGHPCYLIIAGQTLEGAPFCAPQCRVRRLVGNHEAIAPISLKIATRGDGRHEVRVVVIPAADDQLVHCVVDDSDYASLREFIDRVARRAAPRISGHRNACDVLTAREREILSMLARDMTQREIAERLVVSYATVRNHVQHILAKLGVHSILEAIAVCLLEEE